MKILKMFLLAFLLAAGTANAQLADGDWCSNLDGVQSTPPAGYHVEPDYTCTVLQTPVTIDIVPPGGEPQTIDIVQDGGVPQTIDVNPQGSSPQTVTVTDVESAITVSTTTPTMITSISDLQAYIFNPDIPKEEKVAAIENHIKSLLMQWIEILKAEIAAKLAETSTP